MVITKREKENIVIFDVEGEIKRSDVIDVTLHDLVKAGLEEGRRFILLNFEKVGFIDSFGGGEILASYISTQEGCLFGIAWDKDTGIISVKKMRITNWDKLKTS